MTKAPPYVHRILDAYLSGSLLDVQGVHMPADVQVRLDAAFTPQWHDVDPSRELPARGWVGPDDEPVYCDACGRFCHYWELHHLDPIAWGGNPSRLLVDRQLVWVRIDAHCHAVAHMILDIGKRDGAWPDAWLQSWSTPIDHVVVEVARRGWQRYQQRITQEAA